jgi:hypothetical protein
MPGGNGGNGPCAGLSQALGNVTNAQARAALLAALAQAGCIGTA